MMNIQPPHRDAQDDHSVLATSRNSQPGQVLIMFALSITVLLGFVALAVDAGFLMAERRQAQSAADGAAMAADKAYQRNEVVDIIQTGVDYAAELDNSDSIESAHVSITPMASYTVNGISYIKCVEAVVEHNVTPYFVGMFVDEDLWSVSAEAVACTEPELREYAIYATDPDGDGIESSGSANVTITGGGAYSNALNDPAIDLCGSVTWDQGTGFLDSRSGIKTCNNASVTSGDMNPSADPISDPLQTPSANAVAEPSCSGLTTYSNNNPADADRYDPDNPDRRDPEDPWIPDVRLGQTDLTNHGADQRFKPGDYPNGIDVSKAFNIVFEPGLYCLGGNLNLNTNSGELTAIADGVMFYFYGNATMNITGQHVDVIFSKPSSCTNATGFMEACNAGIVIFYARPGSCERLMLNGNDVTVNGIIYAPCSEVQLEGNGNLTINGQLIGGQVEIRGGSVVTINYDSGIASAPAQVYLVK